MSTTTSTRAPSSTKTSAPPHTAPHHLNGTFRGRQTPICTLLYRTLNYSCNIFSSLRFQSVLQLREVTESRFRNMTQFWRVLNWVWLNYEMLSVKWMTIFPPELILNYNLNSDYFFFPLSENILIVKITLFYYFTLALIRINSHKQRRKGNQVWDLITSPKNF